MHKAVRKQIKFILVQKTSIYIELYYIGIKSQKTYICSSFHSPW